MKLSIWELSRTRLVRFLVFSPKSNFLFSLAKHTLSAENTQDPDFYHSHFIFTEIASLTTVRLFLFIVNLGLMMFIILTFLYRWTVAELGERFEISELCPEPTQKNARKFNFIFFKLRSFVKGKTHLDNFLYWMWFEVLRTASK